MGKFLLIFAMSVTVLGAFYAASDQQADRETTARVARDQQTLLARNAALAALDQAEQLLADDFKTYGNMRSTYEGIDFEVKATVKKRNVAVVRATATAEGRDGTNVEFHVRAEYERRPWPRISDEPPNFMQFMVMSDENIEITGSSEGYEYVPADGSTAPANVNLHANGYIDVNGASADFHGFGTYTLGVLPSLTKAKKIFDPNDNPTGSESVYQAVEVPMPELDIEAMAAELVVDSVSTGSVNIAGLAYLPLGAFVSTREDPFIWYIEGNLLFSSDIEIPGYVMFLVKGSVSFEADVTTPPTSIDGEDESTVAYYVGGVTKIAGNEEIWGQIVTKDTNVSATGSPKLYGTLASLRTLSFSGSPTLYHRKASPALTTYWQGGNNDRLVRIAYSEWDLEHAPGYAGGD